MRRERPDGMRSFFEPRSIAVAGVSADPDKLGSIIFSNMTENRGKGLLKARVYALNPAHDRIGDQPCFPDLWSVPETPELLVVAVPESQTLSLMEQAAKVGVKAAIIVTSGYAEVGRANVEKEIGRLAAKSEMRVIGPNTIGVVDTWSGVDSLFLRPTKKLPDGSRVVSMLKPLRGEIAVVSQSGHLAQVVSEELTAGGVGMRALVGTGNQLDVSVEDVIRYFADDPRTKVISVYLEGVRDGRRFMEAAAYATRRKPVVVFKVGKTRIGARAALTHTASLVGDYEVYRAAFRQAGVVEAVSLEELIDYSVALLMLPWSRGKRTAIVTNAGGVGAMAADEAEKTGLAVEPLEPGAEQTLRAKFEGAAFLPNASFRNPFDLTATAPTDDFVRITAAVLALPQFDLGIFLPTHHTPAIDWDVAARLSKVILRSKKPACVSVIGNSELAGRIHREFIAQGIPSFPTPERAVRALASVGTYLRLRDETEVEPVRVRSVARQLKGRGGPMTAEEVSKLLRRYGMAGPRSLIVRSPSELPARPKLWFPLVCKLLSRDLLHKTDVGGVVTGVSSVAEAEAVFRRFGGTASRKRIRFEGMLLQETVEGGVELILGSTRDPTFGPVVALGLGGTYAELLKDYALAIAPVDPREVKRMILQTRLGDLLHGYRGGPKVRLGPLCDVVSSFSKTLAENPSIDQVEVNPLIATARGVFAVDARAIRR